MFAIKTGIHSGTGMNIGILASNSIYVHTSASTGIIPCHMSTCIACMSVLLYILVLISRANTDNPFQYWYTYQYCMYISTGMYTSTGMYVCILVLSRIQY